MTISVIVGVVISLYHSKEANINNLLLNIPILCFCLGFVIYRGVKSQKHSFESIQLITDNETLTRLQFSKPSIIIRYDDITSIEKSNDGYLIIKSNNSNGKLIIPSQIENIIELEIILNNIIQVKSKPRYQLVNYKALGTIMMAIIMMICVYLSDNKIIVGISGLGIVVLMAYAFYQLRTNKSIDDKSKLTSWILLIVIASVIGILYDKLIS
ncbi:hypothetical protein KXQ82_16750 [Mucilaginibacter sp. HMF5004]|uniref:hypothetical protein n=1 Tax=Mucilaginibacter rivuli TaxID=2857527 RepID=UPI001C5D77B9|nr:hypothetical protein [Mucilaginibacter rivuli]MBW4891380.1 hypothetical protein [Mucilaginibacter rivuli]